MNQIEISSILKGAVSPTDLLKPKGTFQMLTSKKKHQNIFEFEGTFFIVKGENFHFQLSVDNTGLYIERNGEQCILTPAMLANEPLRFFLMTWSPNRLRLMTSKLNSVNNEKIIKVLFTDPCSVPISLKKWARDKSLIPTKEYNIEEDFRNAVYQTISDLQSKVEDSGGGESFWDYSYDGNKIKGKKPKKETLVQPLVKAIIDTELYLRGIDVFRENTTPSGDIDFTVVGYVKEIGIVNMCIELKNAHSEYLENGLLKQLPNYMRSQNSEFGAYCILNYNLENGDNKDRADLIQKLLLLKIKSSDPLVKTHIRTFVIDLDKKIVENKKNVNNT